MSGSSGSQCKVYRFDCKKDTDRHAVAYLQGVAAAQKHNFANIFPWEGKCTNDKVYVAVSLDSEPVKRTRASSLLAPTFLARQQNPPTICGWLNCSIERKTRGYISQLTARAAKDLTFKGVGTALVQALEEDAEAMKLDFLYLRPLSNVEGFYKKVGYVKLPQVDHLMFKVFLKAPTDKWLSKQEVEAIADEDITTYILKDVAALDKKAYRKLNALLQRDPSAEFVLLSIYEENGNAEDVVQWILEQDSKSSSASSNTHMRTSTSPISTSSMSTSSPMSTSPMGTGPSHSKSSKKTTSM